MTDKPQPPRIIVPPGISGRKAGFNVNNITLETLACELALTNLGDCEPLNFHINTGQFMQEIAQFKDDWVDYLPRTDRPNNRKGLTVTNLPGAGHRGVPSAAQAMHQLGRPVSEMEFNEKTDVYHACPSLHHLLDTFQPLGRTFLVRCDTGGYFVPHRDHPSMPRNVLRLAVFLNNCAPLQYDWLMDDKKLAIEPGRAYYINTRKTHRTISWVDGSIHLIMNIPFTPETIGKIIANLQHTH
jgi:hypothetical protein